MRLASAVLASAVLAAAVLLFAGPSHAEPPGLSPLAPTPVPRGLETRDPTTALGLSLGGTAAGVGLLASAWGDTDGDVPALVGAALITFGPSFGHAYAGNWLTAGLGRRAFGLVLTGLGVDEALGCAGSDGPCHAGEGTLAAGLALVGAGAIYDIATAPGAARDFNRAHALQLTPTTLHAAGGTVPGIALTGTF